MLKSIFRGRPYGRLMRQLDDARHTLITETAKAEEAQAKAALAQAQIQRLEGWIKEQDDAHAHSQQDQNHVLKATGYSPNTYPSRPVDPHSQSWPVVAPPVMPMTGYQPHPA
jgi:hypothetical protein